MNTYKLSNISVNDFRDFLALVGCNKVKTEGGSPVPEFIVKNTLRNLGMTKTQFFDYYYKKK